MSKVRFYHTPDRLRDKYNFERVTIATKQEGDVIKYGISICSHHNNFDTEIGRAYAIQRLEKNFGEFTLNEHFKKDKRPGKMFLDNLHLSILVSTAKYKVKLKEYPVVEVKPLQETKEGRLKREKRERNKLNNNNK